MQGGGFPEPIGGVDYYTYNVTANISSVDIQPLDIPKKVNDIVNRINDAYNSGAYADGENRQPEDNSADNDRRRDLHSDGQPENGQPENADNGSWENAEVKPPVDVATAEAAAAIGGSATDILSSIAGSGRNSLKSDDAAIPSAIASGDVDYISTALNISPAEARALREAAGKELGTGAVATRINIRKGDGSTGSGLNYAWNKHGPDGNPNKSRFNDGMTQDDVISILKEKNTVNTPAYKEPSSGNYIRNVDTGRHIGTDAKNGNAPTTTLTVITNKKGDLVNVYPGRTRIQ